MNIEIKLTGHKIDILSDPALAANSSGVDKIVITETDWTGEIYGYFTPSKAEAPVIVPVEDLEVKIPAECLKADGFYFGFFVTLMDDQRLTSELEYYRVSPGAGYEGSEPEPTPEVWAKFTQAVEEAKAQTQTAEELVEQAMGMAVKVFIKQVEAHDLLLINFNPAGYSYKDSDCFFAFIDGIKQRDFDILPQSAGNVIVEFGSPVTGVVEILALTAIAGGGSVETDKELIQEDVPADAKAAGDRISALETTTEQQHETLLDHDADIAALLDDVQVLQGQTASTDADLDALAARVTTTEGNISTQGERITATEGNITSQGTRLTTAEGNITGLTGRLTSAETDITGIDARLQAIENLGVADNIGY